jgi:hypothetical protein
MYHSYLLNYLAAVLILLPKVHLLLPLALPFLFPLSPPSRSNISIPLYNTDIQKKPWYSETLYFLLCVM